MTVSSSDSPSQVAVDATNVYWAGQGAIVKMPLAGGAPVTLAHAKGQEVDVFAVDKTNVYWGVQNEKAGSTR